MKFKIFHLLFLAICVCSCKKDNLKTVEVSAERFPVDNSIPADTSIVNFIKPYSDHINETLDSVVVYNPYELDKTDGELNTALGNLMAEIVMKQAAPVFNSRTGKGIDIVLLNEGGIRSRIDKGPVTARTAYRLMPFENEIVIAELTGEKIKEMISYLESNRTAHPILGMKILMDKDYKVVNSEIQGLPIEDDKTYFVATSDYLQKGGDNMNFFKNPVNLYRTDYKIRNAIIDYFNKVDTLKTKRDDRYIRLTK